MRILYLDESGDHTMLTSSPNPGTSVCLALVGVVVQVEALRDLTRAFLELKSLHLHVKAYSPHLLERTHAEVRGSALRKAWQEGAGAASHQLSEQSLDGLFDLMEGYATPAFGQAFIKSEGRPFYGQQSYELALRHACETFQALLDEADDFGAVILDARNDAKNRETAHTIFTRKFAKAEDAFPRIIEIPTFANNLNHAGLQVADWVASALVQPMTSRTFRSDASWSGSGNDSGYDALIDRYLDRLTARQYFYSKGGERLGGLVVSDLHGGRASTDLFP